MAESTAFTPDKIAFPKLEASEMAAARLLATVCNFEDGQTVFRAGDADLDLLIVESGGLEIINPSDENRQVVIHKEGEFAGDIDLLTRRPVVVTGIAHGKTQLLRVSGPKIRELLTRVPRLSEKMLIAIQERRRLLTEKGVLGLKVVGPGKCKDTTVVREFLFKNFVPFTWYDTTSPQGKRLMEGWHSPKKSPVIEYSGGKLLYNPSLRELAEATGIWRHCPTGTVDMAIVGGGPAGMTAAVYAASEGLSAAVLDRLGPGGQAAGSSKIENFIGFPSGLSGAELAMRAFCKCSNSAQNGRAGHRPKNRARRFGNRLSQGLSRLRHGAAGQNRPHCRGREMAKARSRGRGAIRVFGNPLRMHDSRSHSL